jgi:RNA polymerase sigma factor (TIGR02999 family)
MPDPSKGSSDDRSEVSQLLRQWSDGDRAAFDALLPLVYDELRRLAGSFFRHERPGHTLQTTALVHEAYFRLAGQDRVAWQNRPHFFAIAAQAMRRVLVDHARRLAAARRIGPEARTPIGLAAELAVADCAELLDLDDALLRLTELSPRQARIVELRFFAGMTVAEAAEALELSVPTVVRDWRFARAWLRRELGADRDER